MFGNSSTRTLSCAKCDKTYVYEVTIQRGFSDHCDVSCPNCKAHLGEVRCDMGSPTLMQTIAGQREAIAVIPMEGGVIQVVPGAPKAKAKATKAKPTKAKPKAKAKATKAKPTKAKPKATPTKAKATPTKAKATPTKAKARPNTTSRSSQPKR